MARLLDEAALIRALESGCARRRGARRHRDRSRFLPSSPLWNAPNLFITPHTSAVSDRLWQRETALLMELLERWFDGRELYQSRRFRARLLAERCQPIAALRLTSSIAYAALGRLVTLARVHHVLLFLAFLIYDS